MAGESSSDTVYEVADLFRQRCLKEGTSLLWPESRSWTAENVAALLEAFIGHPDVGKRNFFEKWRDQLATQSGDVHRIATDVIAFYHLFPMNISSETKMADVRRVADWKLEDDPPDISVLKSAYAQPLGRSGLYYLTGRPFQVQFYLEFARQVLSGNVDPDDMPGCRGIADEIANRLSGATAARNILLHLLFPEDFEPTASTNQKQKIVQAFPDRTKGIDDVDDALKVVRQSLTGQFGEGFSFYGRARALWDPPEGGDGSAELERVARLLSSRTLDDEDIRTQTGWSRFVEPETRPLLELIDREVGEAPTFYKGGDIAAKRGSYDYVTWAAGAFSAFVYVGMADDERGELERSLSWGLQYWGTAAKAEEFRGRLEDLALQEFSVTIIDGMASLNFGGKTALAYRSLDADVLREQQQSELVSEIVADLTGLIERAKAPPPKVWVEMTYVKDVPHKLEGPSRLGAALWSPQKDKAGHDSYRLMRDVAPGDLVLHLTDAKAFSGDLRLGPITAERRATGQASAGIQF